MLEENLFIFFSLPMIAFYRLMSIFHLLVCAPIRWMRRNLHKLGEHRWSVQSNVHMIDVLEQNMIVLEDCSEK